MSDTKKPKRVRHVTPKGIAIFPWLGKPDTKFKPEGQYKITLRLSEEAAKPLIDKLRPLQDAAIAEAKKNPKNKGKKLTVHDTHKVVLDDNGDPTGEVDFSFKMTASGISKKTNQPWAMKPDLFDAHGQPLGSDVAVWGGSLVKVSFEAVAYDKPIGCGLSLRLNAVQVIKLVSSSRDAGMHGFGDESDDEDAEVTTAGDDTTEGGDEDDGSEDF